MKKIFLFAILLSFKMVLFGQMPERNRAHSALSMQTNHAKTGFQQEYNTKTNFSKPNSLHWSWDTIITYDTLGLMQRLTQTFDIQEHVLTQLTEQWQLNTWVKSARITFSYGANGIMLTSLAEQWIINNEQ